MSESVRREARGSPRPAAAEVERAALLLRAARRPVVIAGGGVISGNASAELAALAEPFGAPVVTTWNGKGAIDQAHDLAALTICCALLARVPRVEPHAGPEPAQA